MQLSDLSLRLHALSVLRGVLCHPLVNAYAETLTALDGTAADFRRPLRRTVRDPLRLRRYFALLERSATWTPTP
ncbi:MAG: hypothetical protein ACLR4Z_18905 [Butyricicoccaceae bacterium]